MELSSIIWKTDTMEELKKQVRKIALSHLDIYRYELGISYDRDELSEDLWIECEEEGYVYNMKQEWEPLSPFVKVSELNSEYWVTVSTENVFLECFGIQIKGNEVTLDTLRKDPENGFWKGNKKVLFSFVIEEVEFREHENKRDRKAKLTHLKERYGD
jgi:hypothetical protein